MRKYYCTKKKKKTIISKANDLVYTSVESMYKLQGIPNGKETKLLLRKIS